MSTPPQIQPLQQVTYKKSDFDDESLTLLNQDLTNIRQAVNGFLGVGGVAKFPAGIDLAGSRVQNVGPAQAITDAVSQEYGNTQYGAAALKPLFESLGKQVMQTYRRLSDPNQQEQTSSHLNSLSSTSPTTNSSIVIPGIPTGGFVPVTITGGLHQFMDRSAQPYAAYNDSLPLAVGYPISGSLVRSGGVVSGATVGANILVAGDTIAIINASDSSFNGQFVLASAASPNFTYNQSAPNGSATGATISFGNVYYYLRSTGQSVLNRVGPFGEDTWENRLNGSFDRSTLIATVVVTGMGIDPTASSAGATPPAQTNGVRIFGRL